MTIVEIEAVTEMVSELEIPCDYSDDEMSSCPDAPARWVLHLNPCPCGRGGARLACDHCKQVRLEGEGVVMCECGEVTYPAHAAYYYVEAL